MLIPDIEYYSALSLSKCRSLGVPFDYKGRAFRFKSSPITAVGFPLQSHNANNISVFKSQAPFPVGNAFSAFNETKLKTKTMS